MSNMLNVLNFGRGGVWMLVYLGIAYLLGGNIGGWLMLHCWIAVILLVAVNMVAVVWEARP